MNEAGKGKAALRIGAVIGLFIGVAGGCYAANAGYYLGAAGQVGTADPVAQVYGSLCTAGIGALIGALIGAFVGALVHEFR